MNDAILQPLSVLCDEVGIPLPPPDAQGVIQLDIDGAVLRVRELNRGRVVLLGVIGNAATLAEQRHETRLQLLSSCLTLQAVRFGRLGTAEVLTLEPETGELVLWLGFEEFGLTISSLLAAAESLLNELDFWKQWFAAAS